MRRERLAIQVIERLAAHPSASIRGVCSDWAETQVSCPFLGNDAHDRQDILELDRQCTQARMATHPMVLCLQDTTELDFNGRAIECLDPLSYEAQRGMYLHPTHEVRPERESLGILDTWMWVREFKYADGNRPVVPERLS